MIAHLLVRRRKHKGLEIEIRKREVYRRVYFPRAFTTASGKTLEVDYKEFWRPRNRDAFGRFALSAAVRTSPDLITRKHLCRAIGAKAVVDIDGAIMCGRNLDADAVEGLVGR